MQCPVCNLELRMSERQGVEIDYCPQCRGVWLDRGELDKIIERNGQEQQRGFGGGQRAEEPRYGTEPRREERSYPEPRPGYTSIQGGYPPRKKKRESFLDDLFDFD
jgi:Zn-finger nucleic acid-binding protein